ncbi:MAG TPA: radical SAM protein [Acidimicrobiales bacterium]|nr:radical SAM protein [Acidimicrobiales bacterium]
MTDLRWKLAGDRDGQGVFFEDEELIERHVGRGEYRALEFLHVNARRIVNEVPAASRMPFRYTINAYRGCSHACVYCLHGDTPILMADGRQKPLRSLRLGDAIYGTVRIGTYRRFVQTEVLAMWSTVKPAFRVTCEDGTELIASADHRFLTERGWKHVTGAEQGLGRRPHLTLGNKLMGVGALPLSPEHDADYRQGYLCGMVRGDASVGTYVYPRRRGRGGSTVHRFRLALVDHEALHRTRQFLDASEIRTTEFQFCSASPNRQALQAIRTSTAAGVTSVRRLIEWPETPSEQWRKGFLAGIFDAEGSYSRGVLRIANGDTEIIDRTTQSLDVFGFPLVVEQVRDRPMYYVRLLGGLASALRFFLTVDPAISRKRRIDGHAVKTSVPLGVRSIEPLGLDLPLYDITTGTGDFIANSVVSHNCFARPTHEYLGLNLGEDFERKLVVKVNAVERLRAELASPRWGGEHIAMGTNTDPYQRCEGKYHLTRGIVEVLGEAQNPFSILTKSTLILRDLDVLAAAAGRTEVRANLSIGTLDEAVWKATEPGTPHPRRRVEAVARLNQAGIPCGVLVAPILPGLSDGEDQLAEVVEACVAAGAVSVTAISLHLRPGVREHFLAWLAANRPDLLGHYERRYRRSYLPGKEQDEVAGLVRRLVADARGRWAPALATRPVGARPAAAVRPAPPLAEQMGLGL